MKKYLLKSLCVSITLLMSPILGFSKSNTATKAQPKLVVGIVVDQMRWDYLYRYHARYGNDGFKRLLREGFSADQTNYNYLPTTTAAGHTSIYTGSVPALHGIVGNDWYDVDLKRDLYCTEDKTVQPIGTTDKSGLMSPRNMKATTITDELRLFSNFQNKTIGISIKDRGAILPAGHFANAAYWLGDGEGKFISSSYYISQLPKWAQAFNERKVVDSLLNIDWNTLYDINSYTSSTKDDMIQYEGRVKGLENVTFPHVLKPSIADNKNIIRTTPWGNTMVRLMAEACIEGEQMGSSKFTDFLAVSFSSTDMVGHMFGPNSIEVEDTYLRLDQEIAQFLKYLDQKVGKGNYLLFLTADHGSAHNVQFLKDHKYEVANVPEKVFTKTLNTYLTEQFGTAGIIIDYQNNNLYFNNELITQKGLDKYKIYDAVRTWGKQQKSVNDIVAYDRPILLPAQLTEMVANGYHAKRVGDMIVILEPGYYTSSYTTGTTHGSWNRYDSHVPALFFGWGVKKGNTNRATNITDIAVTIASILKIQMPNAAIGQPIVEAIK